MNTKKATDNGTSNAGTIEGGKRTPGHEIESPLPWSIEQSAFSIAEYVVRDANGSCVLTKLTKLEAERIVRCCNSHDELVKIAQAYRNLLKTMAHTDGEVATYHHIGDVLASLENKN